MNQESQFNKYKWILPVLATVFVLVACVVDAKVSGVNHFASNTKVDGVDVSGMTISEATKALEYSLNTITVKSGDDEKELASSFKYGSAVQLHERLVLSHIDPRHLFGKVKNYKVGLNVIDGVDKTSSTLLGLFPPLANEIKTQNAYIDYTTMEVVSEVQGNNLNYTGVTLAIAEQRKSDPTNSVFSFNREDYYVMPSIVAEDLAEECEWAKEHLAQGIDVERPSGATVHLNAKIMAMFVLYNDGDIEYNKEAAMSISDKLAGSDKPEKLKIETVNGVKVLDNYVIPVTVDREKSAKSLIKSAQACVEGDEPIVAKIFTNTNETVKLGDHVEVSTEMQKLWLIKNDKVVLESPVVTGNRWSNDTPHGIYKVAYKESPATLKGDNGDGTEYSSYVNFWMPFNGGIGLHDASWRSTYGGSIYMGNGSHGCVNCPYDTAERLYQELSAGSIVVVY